MPLSLCRTPTSADNLQAQVTAGATKLTESVERLQSQKTIAAARVDVLEGTSNLVHKEASTNLAALGATVAGFQAPYAGAGAAPAPAWAPPAAVDPMADHKDSWSRSLGNGGQTPVQVPVFASTPFGGRPPSVPIYTPPTLDVPRVNGCWALYDEKWIMRPRLNKNRYDGKSPQLWLESTRDYLASPRNPNPLSKVAEEIVGGFNRVRAFQQKSRSEQASVSVAASESPSAISSERMLDVLVNAAAGYRDLQVNPNPSVCASLLFTSTFSVLNYSRR